MKIRSHHKVGPDSIYWDKDADAPWPLKGYLVRVGLLAAVAASFLLWFVALIVFDAIYVHGGNGFWDMIFSPAVICIVATLAGALILLSDPLGYPIADFKAVLVWVSPPAVIFYRLPLLVWMILRGVLRVIGKIARAIVLVVIGPFAPIFFHRFIWAAIIGFSLICWNIVPLVVHLWIPFSRNGWDLSVVIEVAAVVPLAFVANRLYDQTGMAWNDPYRAPDVMQNIFPFINPATLFYGLVIEPIIYRVGRKIYGPGFAPTWL